MKRSLSISIWALFFALGHYSVIAQCTGGTASCCQFAPMTTTYQTISFQHNVYKTFDAVSGATYTFTYCSGGATSSYDTEITIQDNTGAPVVGGYNDDFCGTASELIWVAPSTAQYRVLTTEYISSWCNLTANVSTMAYKFTPAAPVMATEPTAQPSNLVFSNIALTSFTIAFTAASGSPDGYIGVANAGGSPSFLPVDGTTYSNGQSVGTGDFISFSTSSTTVNATGAAQSTTLTYKIYSYNGSGTSRNYRTTSPLTGSVTTLSPDSNPPTVTDTTPNTIAKGANITFTLTASDPSGMDGVYIDYGKAEKVIDVYDYADPNVSFIELTNTAGSTYTATIPANDVGEMGIVYYITAYDNFGNEYYNDPAKIITVKVEGSGLTIPYTNPGARTSNYKIVSVPLSLDKKSVNDVFGDDLGTYGDKTSWRMFRYQSGKNAELTGTSSIDAGKGYWLISTKAATIDSGPGTTFNGSFDSPATLSLSTGWNQVGNPYTFNLLWQDVVDWNSGLTLGSLKTFSGGSFTNGSVLKTMEGGFILAQASGTVEFPLFKNPSAGRVGEEKPNSNPIDSDNWEVLFSIKNGDLVNQMGGLGMNKEADILNDRFDDFTLPRFFDYLEINHKKQFVGIPFSRDVIPVHDNYVWEFDIESNVGDKIVELTWDNSFFGANEMQMILWDDAKQLAIDMRKSNVYHFDKTISKPFRVYYGNEAFIDETVTTYGITFHEVFPIPAKDKVTFAFSLPKDGGIHGITFEVYDLMGRKIGSSIDGVYSSGYHEVSWSIADQGDTPNGLYLVKLKKGVIEKTKKFIIKQ